VTLKISGKKFTLITKVTEIERSLVGIDAMGIYATANTGNIICSPDKDMKQIPGKLYDFNEVVDITPEQGMQWHYIQTLAGDQTDGYSGVPGIGVKRAVDLFNEKGYTWSTIVQAFAEKDLGEDVALMNARLAKILTYTDYDPIQRQVIPWTPTTTSDAADGGTRVQDTTPEGSTA
jgi:DNA polymerase-1